ncbi:MAG: VOC family protein [Spirochaetes bacterium]|jgi:PhnB protein|nr:VOC family protein [Spirochaetota bacterium]
MARHTERHPARPGFHTITPYLIVDDLESFLSFIQTVFDATETLRMRGGSGGTHVEVRIGDSMLMIGSGGGWSGTSLPAALYLYIDDVDERFRRALAAGATTMMEPRDEEDGDRRGGVQDPFGNMWFIARHQR